MTTVVQTLCTYLRRFTLSTSTVVEDEFIVSSTWVRQRVREA